jgi:hypothetical protein
MALSNVHRSLSDPDVAWLDIQNGLTLYVWSAGNQVRGQILITHEQGQQTLVWDGVVATGGADSVDSTRCVSVADQYFVVYWLERDSTAGTYTLESSYLDMEDTDGGISWTSNSTITPDDAGLYDVKNIENASPTEYMLTWATTTTACVVRRVTGPDHTTDVAWSTTITTNHADRVLAVHADNTSTANDGGVLVVFQDTDNDLRGFILDHSDGTSVGAFDILAGAAREYGAVGIAGMTRTGGSVRAAVVAEFEDTAIEDFGLTPSNLPQVHFIVMAEVGITAFPGVVSNTHITPNLNMMSKPYAVTDANGEKHVYCGLGYKTIAYPNQWAQYVAFVCDLNAQRWSATANTIRPRPVLTLNLASVDSDIHAFSNEASAFISGNVGKRMNHLSNWIPGPNLLCDTRKSRTVAWPMWSRQSSVEDGTGSAAQGTNSGTVVHPAGATVRGIVHYLEDPWTVNRDSLSLGQPSINYHGANPLSLYDNVELPYSLVVAGGAPQSYDGKAIVELGFPWNPEIVCVEDNPSGSQAGFPTATYTYIAVYEWTDAKGQLHRSGYSTPYAFDNDGDDNPLVIVRTMTISNKDASWQYPTNGPIYIALYRNTQDNLDRFYRIHATEVSGWTPADLPENDPTQWAIAIHDGLLDNFLTASPQLPFVGVSPAASELPPFQPPAMHAVASWRNRVWGPSSENPDELWYSKEVTPNAGLGKIAPEFSPFLVFRLDSIRGDVVALQPMDDQLIIFTREGIYSLSGDGANELGEGSTLTLQTLHEGTGCIEPRSIALCPMGILFQSYKGLFLLDKGAALDHETSGAPIITEVGTSEAIGLSGNLRSAVHLPDRNVVAFTGNDAVTNSPVILKWEYYMRAWSKDVLPPPNLNAWLSSSASSTVWNGNERDASHVVLCQGNLLIERGRDDTTPYRDETSAGAVSAVCMDIETAWVHFAGIAGQVRVSEIGIQLGSRNVTGALYTELDVERYGTYSTSAPEPYNFGGAYHGDLEAYLPIKPVTQRMTAFRLRLYEPAAAVGEGQLEINGFSCVVGILKGSRRVNNATRGVVP